MAQRYSYSSMGLRQTTSALFISLANHPARLPPGCHTNRQCHSGLKQETFYRRPNKYKCKSWPIKPGSSFAYAKEVFVGWIRQRPLTGARQNCLLHSGFKSMQVVETCRTCYHVKARRSQIGAQTLWHCRRENRPSGSNSRAISLMGPTNQLLCRATQARRPPNLITENPRTAPPIKDSLSLE